MSAGHGGEDKRHQPRAPVKGAFIGSFADRILVAIL